MSDVCGVVAVLSPQGGLSGADLDRPIQALRHRGPDGAGTWVSPSARAALGHTRLAVIDLRTGAQPIGDPGNRYRLVASGEFYGYEKIRQDLIRAGCELRTRSDSEIALHLYAMEGERGLARLRGEFAFVIWDEVGGVLFAARDRFGIKPLYYAEHEGRTYVASEIKALLACGVVPRWDEDAFAEHLLVSHPADRTLFAGIRQVPPGCFLLADRDGHVTVSSYWDIDYPTAHELADENEGAASPSEVREVVNESVRIRLRSDVPLAAHLSGGLDSSSVVALATGPSVIPTFTVRFDDDAFDEGAVAKDTASWLGSPHTEIFVARDELAWRIDEVVAAGEMIQENSHGLARLVQSEVIRADGYSVVLAGEGGDEMFAGYPQFLQDLAFTTTARERERTRAGYVRLDAQVGLPGHLRALIDRLGFVPSWVAERYLQVTLPLLPLMRRDLARRLAAARPLTGLIDASGTQAMLAGRTPFHQSIYLFYKSWLCTYILAAERLDMASAVEVRLPFLDHHVFEAVRRTPLSGYARDGASKVVLRDAMRDRLPTAVLGGRKQGFFAPPAVASDAVLARLRTIMAEGASPFFVPEKVAAFLDRVGELPPERRAPHERVVQILASTCLLGAHFGMAGGGDS
jgi:asparagine synthase (glutamine-hydrolysing)